VAAATSRQAAATSRVTPDAVVGGRCRFTSWHAFLDRADPNDPYYYQGQGNIDAVERLARARLAELFGAEWVNVQPYSGSPANLAVYLAFCQAGDTITGLGLLAGGHSAVRAAA